MVLFLFVIHLTSLYTTPQSKRCTYKIYLKRWMWSGQASCRAYGLWAKRARQHAKHTLYWAGRAKVVKDGPSPRTIVHKPNLLNLACFCRVGSSRAFSKKCGPGPTTAPSLRARVVLFLCSCRARLFPCRVGPQAGPQPGQAATTIFRYMQPGHHTIPYLLGLDFFCCNGKLSDLPVFFL